MDLLISYITPSEVLSEMKMLKKLMIHGFDKIDVSVVKLLSKKSRSIFNSYP